MTSAQRTMGRAQQKVGSGGDWTSKLARAGLAAKGVIYVVIGLIAIDIATGGQAAQASTSGAIERIARQPFGQVLLALLTVGLFSLSIWRAIDAVRGDPVEGSEAKDRAKYAVKAFLYFSAASSALTILLANWGKQAPSATQQGGAGQGGGQGAGQTTATVMSWPAGRWLVIIGGLAVIAFGIYNFYKKGVQHDFDDWLQRGRMSDTEETAVIRAGQIGYTGRAITFVIVGVFLAAAGINYNPSEAVGISGALERLADDWWGVLLLYVIAVGLFAYGLFNIALARYRRTA